MKNYPTTAAQDTVLAALGLSARDYPDAEKIFERLGIQVIPTRQGRRSVPRVTILSERGGAFNSAREGVEWERNFSMSREELREKLSEYIEKE